MIGFLAAATALGGASYTYYKGVPVKSGRLGQPGIGPKWRIRFAFTHWKAQAWSQQYGWQSAGEYDTPELAKNAAIEKAMGYVAPALPGATGGGGPVLTQAAVSFAKKDI